MNVTESQLHLQSKSNFFPGVGSSIYLQWMSWSPLFQPVWILWIASLPLSMLTGTLWFNIDCKPDDSTCCHLLQIVYITDVNQDRSQDRVLQYCTSIWHIGRIWSINLSLLSLIMKPFHLFIYLFSIYVVCPYCRVRPEFLPKGNHLCKGTF